MQSSDLSFSFFFFFFFFLFCVSKYWCWKACELFTSGDFRAPDLSVYICYNMSVCSFKHKCLDWSRIWAVEWVSVWSMREVCHVFSMRRMQIGLCRDEEAISSPTTGSLKWFGPTQWQQAQPVHSRRNINSSLDRGLELHFLKKEY